jgi:hypothetical protein
MVMPCQQMQFSPESENCPRCPPLIASLSLLAVLMTACVPHYIDDPPTRKISGRVIRGDTGIPVGNASVSFHSGRKLGFCMLPWDTFGIDAATVTDQTGRFTVVAKLADRVVAIVQNGEFAQRFDLPAFLESNQLEGLVWKLSEKRANSK